MTPEEIAALPYRPCVGMMVLNAAGLVFVGQRRDSSAPAWQMPQGGIDDGEAPRSAALRELREETGITADLVEVIAEAPDWIAYDLLAEVVPRIWKGRYRGQRQRWFLMRFLGQDAQIGLDVTHPEFSAWKWTDRAALLAEIVPFKRAVYGQVVAAFAQHLGPGSAQAGTAGNDA